MRVYVSLLSVSEAPLAWGVAAEWYRLVSYGNNLVLLDVAMAISLVMKHLEMNKILVEEQ